MSDENRVPIAPTGVAIVVQYWAGDRAPALRLARLLADVEPRFRPDATLVLARRRDCDLGPEDWATIVHCGRKFRVMPVQSKLEGTGHPDGSYALWAGAMHELWAAYYRGDTQFDSAFFVEADGCPLARDWIDRLRAEHAIAMRRGRRIIGAVVDQVDIDVPAEQSSEWIGHMRAERAVSLRGGRHVNGTLMAHLSMWADRPSLHQTPPGHAWDLFHAPVLLHETHATPLIWNPYGTTCWAPATLRVLGRQSAWLCNAKDESAVRWAERELVDRGRCEGYCGKEMACRNDPSCTVAGGLCWCTPACAKAGRPIRPEVPELRYPPL